jgi:ribosomal protein S18 acetylase RimI-like enzyme
MLEFDDAPKGLARLIYASRSVSVGGDLAEQVRAILVKSIHNNRLAAISGFLVVGEGRFLQVLEGPAGEVEATFQRVSRDPRHGDIVVIAKGPADRRLFRDWNLAQHLLKAADQPLLAELGLSGFTPDLLNEEQALRVLTTFGGRHQR